MPCGFGMSADDVRRGAVAMEGTVVTWLVHPCGRHATTTMAEACSNDDGRMRQWQRHWGGRWSHDDSSGANHGECKYTNGNDEGNVAGGNRDGAMTVTTAATTATSSLQMLVMVATGICSPSANPSIANHTTAPASTEDPLNLRGTIIQCIWMVLLYPR